MFPYCGLNFHGPTELSAWRGSQAYHPTSNPPVLHVRDRGTRGVQVGGGRHLKEQRGDVRIAILRRKHQRRVAILLACCTSAPFCDGKGEVQWDGIRAPVPPCRLPPPFPRFPFLGRRRSEGAARVSPRLGTGLVSHSAVPSDVPLPSFGDRIVLVGAPHARRSPSPPSPSAGASMTRMGVPPPRVCVRAAVSFPCAPCPTGISLCGVRPLHVSPPLPSLGLQRHAARCQVGGSSRPDPSSDIGHRNAGLGSSRQTITSHLPLFSSGRLRAPPGASGGAWGWGSVEQNKMRQIKKKVVCGAAEHRSWQQVMHTSQGLRTCLFSRRKIQKTLCQRSEIWGLWQKAVISVAFESEKKSSPAIYI